MSEGGVIGTRKESKADGKESEEEVEKGYGDGGRKKKRIGVKGKRTKQRRNKREKKSKEKGTGEKGETSTQEEGK